MRKIVSAAPVALMMILALAAGGCQEGGKTETDVAVMEIMPGLTYVDSVVGQGPEVADWTISSMVHYTGWVYVDGAKGEQVRQQRRPRRAHRLPPRPQLRHPRLGKGPARHAGRRQADPDHRARPGLR